MNKIAIYILVIISALACQPSLDYKISGYTEKIIVEGWISNGEYPKVYLSLNVPLSEHIDTVTILEKVIRTAKVTVSDGVKTEVLTSRWDKNNFPPYVYRGTEIKGEVGKTYYLTVDYSGYSLSAKTTIPVLADIQGLTFIPMKDNDSLRILAVRVLISENDKKGYTLYSNKKKEGVFYKTHNVYNESLSLKGEQSFIITPQPKISSPSYEEKGYFLKGDTVLLKVCTIDSVSTGFFKELSGNAGLGRNIFVGQTKSLNSNISEPGFGIWYGMGVKNLMTVIE